jgi:hypothetical protein
MSSAAPLFVNPCMCLPLHCPALCCCRFVEYAEDRSTRESQRFWFSVMDADGDGRLSWGDMKLLYDAVQRSCSGGILLHFEDLMNQIRDMVSRQRAPAQGFTAQEMWESKLGAGVIGLLTNANNMLLQRSTAEWGRGEHRPGDLVTNTKGKACSTLTLAAALVAAQQLMQRMTCLFSLLLQVTSPCNCTIAGAVRTKGERGQKTLSCCCCHRHPACCSAWCPDRCCSRQPELSHGVSPGVGWVEHCRTIIRAGLCWLTQKKAWGISKPAIRVGAHFSAWGMGCAGLTGLDLGGMLGCRPQD